MPDDLAKNLFGGSLALGMIMATLGVAGLVTANRFDIARQRFLGATLAVAGALLFLTYGADGLIIGLGSTTTTACVIVALGLGLAIQQDRSEPEIRGSKLPAPATADAETVGDIVAREELSNPLSADMRSCPVAVTELPAGGQQNCPLAVR